MVWHVARVEDRWLHRFAQDTTEVWQRDGWYQRCGVPEHDTGVGYTAAQVTSFPNPDLKDLQGYFDAVRQETFTYLHGIDASVLDVHPQRIPFPEGERRTPLPDDFTIGRMFRQLIGEENQHLARLPTCVACSVVSISEG